MGCIGGLSVHILYVLGVCPSVKCKKKEGLRVKRGGGGEGECCGEIKEELHVRVYERPKWRTIWGWGWGAMERMREGKHKGESDREREGS